MSLDLKLREAYQRVEELRGLLPNTPEALEAIDAALKEIAACQPQGASIDNPAPGFGVIAHTHAEEELRKVNRLLRARSHSNQAMMRAANENDYLQEACRIVVEDCGHAMVWVGLAEDDAAKTVRSVASSGFEEGYLQRIRISWADNEHGRGPTGRAIRTMRPVVCHNMQTDPRMAPWREEALRRGYNSSLALPLIAAGNTLGALTIYSPMPEGFTEDEVRLLAGLANDLAFGMSALRLRESHARAEEALRESEQQVRRKLENILSPAGDTVSLHLADVLEIEAVQKLMDTFYQLATIPMAILDLEGNVLVGVGWQDICTKFHRMHPEACAHCLESDTELTADILPDTFRLYKCKNNMWDIATPIVVGGVHVGNLFMGQFFFENDPVDYELFRLQAQQYGFEEEAYIAALERVPRLTHETVNAGMDFFLKLSHMLSQLSYSNIKLARALAERDRLMENLRRSEANLARAQQMARMGSWEVDLQSNEVIGSEGLYPIFDLAPDTKPLEAFIEQMHPEDRQRVREKINETLNEHKPYDIEYRVNTRMGERIIHAMGEANYDASGNPVAFFGAVQDITDSKRTELALREAHDLLEQRVRARTAALEQEIAGREKTQQALIEQSQILEAFYHHTVTPLVFLDNEFNFLRVNEAYALSCGRNAEDFRGKNHFELYPSEELEAQFRNVVETGDPYLVYARPFVFPEHPEWGTSYWNLSVVPLLDAAGNVESLVFSLQDVTRRALDLQRLQVVNEIQSLFTTKATRREYLEAVVDVVKRWSECQNVGIRVLDDLADLSYDAFVGFTPEFMRLEAHLSLTTDTCACIRVAVGLAEPQEEALFTNTGSFHCNNTMEWLAQLSPEECSRYRGNCISAGFASLAIIPVRYQKEPIGLLHVADSRPGAISSENVAFMESLAPLIGEAIHRFNVEEALLKASQHARSLIEASLDPLVTISPDGQITDVNEATERATGVPREQLIGSDFSGYFTEPEQAAQGYRYVLNEGQLRDFPLTIRHVSGSTMFVLYNATLYKDETGQPRGVFAAARDISERKQAEEERDRYRVYLEELVDALQTSEESLAEAQRIAHIGNSERDLVSGKITWSDELFRIFGLEPQSFEPAYEAVMGMIHPEDRASLTEAIAQSIEDRVPFAFDYRIYLPSGEMRYLHAQGEPRLDNEGRPVRVVGTVHDITERVLAEREAKARQQQLAQAEKMVSLGILVSGIAHEINNPNHSIMSNASTLESIWKDAPAILDRFYDEFGDFVLGGYDYSTWRDRIPTMFTGILDNAKRIQVIVQELRDFARQSPTDNMGPVNANAVIESAHVLVGNLLRKSTDRFQQHFAPDLPLVLANFQRLEQVVINLVQNACQAITAREQAIVVSTAFDETAEAVIIEVRDEGPGISPEDLQHATDPFFTTKRGTGGMGLGLWICHNIVHEHGGKLLFESELGKGTIARVVLPAMKQEVKQES